MFIAKNKAIVEEMETHRFVTEASLLGLEPGVWPAVIHTDLGNGQPLGYDHSERDEDGNVVAMTYRQRLGCITVRIFND